MSQRPVDAAVAVVAATAVATAVAAIHLIYDIMDGPCNAYCRCASDLHIEMNVSAVCIRMCMHPHTHTHMHTYIHIVDTWAFHLIYGIMDGPWSAHCMCTSDLHIEMHVGTVWIRMCMHMDLEIDMHPLIHTHTHTYIHVVDT
jgi:hypothetical protein